MAVWSAPGQWKQRLEAERDRHLVDLPGNLWFRMTPPAGGAPRRVHSGLALEKLKRGWSVQGIFVQADDGEFPA